MRKINTNTKNAAIKLFLSGFSYDEISQKLGIGKGSVVSIIDDFRDGRIPVPEGMTEYVDELRRVVVDLRKQGTTASQLQSYARTDRKLVEMGVSSDQAEEWLDLCQDVASSARSGGELVGAALELARLSSETGMSYAEVVSEYQTKMARLEQVDGEINKKTRELNGMKARHRVDAEQVKKGLDAINKAAETAQENFRRQKDQMQSELNEYAARRRLTLKEVDMVVALFNKEFAPCWSDN